MDGDHGYTGNLFALLNPFGILGGLTMVGLFRPYGVVFLALKTAGAIGHRAWALRLALLVVAVATGFLVWTQLDRGTVASGLIALRRR